MGSGMMRPEGSAIRPRMPANCEMGPKPPLVAPDLAIMARLPAGFRLADTALATSSRARVHISMMRSFSGAAGSAK